jgi:hypothetical protein
MIVRSKILGVTGQVMFGAVITLSATGCQTNPMFWTDGTKVEIYSDRSFVVSLAGEKFASLGGPVSERAQEYILTSLKAKGCVPTAPIEKGGYAWGGYWYAGGKCK